MRITLAPIDCRLQKRTVRRIARAMKYELLDYGLEFVVTPPQELLGAHARGRVRPEDYLEFMEETFPQFTVVVTSRRLQKSRKGDAKETYGVAWEDQRYAIARTDPGLSTSLKYRDLSQTIVHEVGHLAGMNHHTGTVLTPQRRICPMTDDTDPRLTDLRYCVACYNTFSRFNGSL